MAVRFTLTMVTDEDASGVASEVLETLVDYSVDIKTTGAYPDGEVYIVRVDDDGDLVVSPMERGVPDLHVTTAIPMSELITIYAPFGSAC